MYGKISLALVCAVSSVLAWERKEEQQPKEPEAFEGCTDDCDLFSKDKRVFFVNASFLYWTVNEGALDFAIKMKKPAWGDVTDAVGHYKVSEFGWDPGVRVNFGYFYAPHYWDMYVEYTHFKGTGHDHVHAPEKGGLFLNGTFPQPNPIADVPLKKAESEIEFRLNLLDWVVSRRFYPNPHLRMRLYGGINVAWLRQNWEIDYRDTDNVKSHLHNQWHFTGAGIHFGTVLDWYMHITGLYITGGASAACYAGTFHNTSKQKSDFEGFGFKDRLPFRNAHYQDTRLVPKFSVILGPSWQQSFESFRTELFLGYELNIWANLHEVIRTNSGTPKAAKLTTLDSGWIGIQGITLRWNLDY